MDTSNHRPTAEPADYGCFCQQYDSNNASMSRRSIDWRDSGIVIDEDNHLFDTLYNFDTRSSINSEQYNFPSTSSNVSTATCSPMPRVAFDQDDDGDTMLHLAVVGFILDKVKDLIDLCDLNAINNMMQTPLHVATLVNRPEIVQLLVDFKAQLNVHDRRGNTPLHLASQSGSTEIVEIILNAIAKKSYEELTVQQMIETRNFDGYTSLHLAAINDKRNIIELLVKKYGADMNCKDSKSGETIMHKAVRQFNVDLVAFILKLSDQHCNSRDFSGREPLDTVEVLQEAHFKDPNQSAKLGRIYELIETSMRHCIAKRGCCAGRPARRSESLEKSDYSSSNSGYSDSECELN